jgi:hypothetical protein
MFIINTNVTLMVLFLSYLLIGTNCTVVNDVDKYNPGMYNLFYFIIQ